MDETKGHLSVDAPLSENPLQACMIPLAILIVAPGVRKTNNCTVGSDPFGRIQ
jgi:hypothetical protein